MNLHRGNPPTLGRYTAVGIESSIVSDRRGGVSFKVVRSTAATASLGDDTIVRKLNAVQFQLTVLRKSWYFGLTVLLRERDGLPRGA